MEVQLDIEQSEVASSVGNDLSVDETPKWYSFVSLLLFSYEGDKPTFINAIRKGSRSRFSVLTPEVLLESFKRKESEFFEEIKKHERSKEIPHELVLRLMVAKIEEDCKIIEEQRLKNNLTKRNQTKKKARVTTEHTAVPNSNSLAVEPATSNSLTVPNVINDRGTTPAPPKSAKTPATKMRTSRVPVVDDYPIDGPEIYYFLVDIIQSIQDIKWLQLRNINLDCILNIPNTKEDISKNSNNNINVLYNNLVGLINQNNEVLANTLYRDIQENEDFAERVYSVVNLKKRFIEWQGKTQLITLPDVTIKSCDNYTYYTQHINETPNNALTPSFLVNSVLDQLSYTADDIKNVNEESDSKSLEEYFKNTLEKLKGTSTKSSDNVHVNSLSKSTLLAISKRDYLGIKLRKALVCENSEIEKLEKQSFNKHVKDIIDQKTSAIEIKGGDVEIIERLEFHSTSNFTPDSIDTTLLQFEFEDLVHDFLHPPNEEEEEEEAEEETVSFGDRYYLEEIDEDILLQSISTIPNCIKYNIITGGYPYLSTYLLAVHLSVPSTRLEILKEWKPNNIFSIGFGSWSKLYPNEETLSQDQQSPIYDVDEKEVANCQEYNIYPTDGSVINVKKFTNSHNSIVKTVESRVWNKDIIFGISSIIGDHSNKTTFVLNLDNDSLFVEKEEEEESIRSVFNSSDGLIISHNLSKTPFLCLKSTQRTDVDSIIITERGSLLFNFIDGTKKLVTIEGETSEFKENGWVSTNLEGLIFSRKEGVLEHTGNMWVAKHTNIESNSITITREDMLQIKKSSLDSTSTSTQIKCPDGTLIINNKQNNIVTITSPGFPIVTVNTRENTIQCSIKDSYFTLSRNKEDILELYIETNIDNDQKKTAIKMNQNSLLVAPPSYFEFNFSPLPSNTINLPGTYHIDLLLAKLETHDNIGNEFGIGTNFNPVVNIIKQDISVYQSHPVKLFLYNPSGQIYELLSDDNVNKYLSQKQKEAILLEKNVENSSSRSLQVTSEPTIGKEGFVSISVVETLPSANLVLFRKLIKLPNLDKESSEQLMDQLDLFAENKKDNNNNNNNVNTKRPDPYKFNTKQQQTQIDEAVNKIVKERTGITSQQTKVLAPINTTTKSVPQIKKLGTTPTNTAEKISSGKQSARKIVQTKPITPQKDTLKYFECEEGLSFLQQQIKM